MKTLIRESYSSKKSTMEIIRILAKREVWPLPNEISRMIGHCLEDERLRKEHKRNNRIFRKELEIAINCYEVRSSCGKIRPGQKDIKNIALGSYRELCKNEMEEAKIQNRADNYNNWNRMYLGVVRKIQSHVL